MTKKQKTLIDLTERLVGDFNEVIDKGIERKKQTDSVLAQLKRKQKKKIK